jgi:hypothetical protein
MFWRNVIVHNLGLKIFSVLLATLVWLAARTQIGDNPTVPAGFASDEAQRPFENQQVLVLTSAADPRVFQVDPLAVSVVVSGPAQQVQHLKEAEVGVFVRAPQGDSEYVPVHVNVPKGVAVVQVRPEAAKVSVKVPQPSGAKAEEPKR